MDQPLVNSLIILRLRQFRKIAQLRSEWQTSTPGKVLGSQTENPESLPNTERRKKTLFYYSAEQNTQKGYKGE